jgi:hypothetical protein
LHDLKTDNMLKQIAEYNLRAVKHVSRLERQVKTPISSLDGKRYLLDDGVTQLPQGHWRIDKCE